MKKHFSTLTVIGLYTGMLLEAGGFGSIHECAEHVAGHPIWTHEFASKTLWEGLAIKLELQIPDLHKARELVDGFNTENYAEKTAACLARWPDGFDLEEGTDVRSKSPIEIAEELFSQAGKP